MKYVRYEWSVEFLFSHLIFKRKYKFVFFITFLKLFQKFKFSTIKDFQTFQIFAIASNPLNKCRKRAKLITKFSRQIGKIYSIVGLFFFLQDSKDEDFDRIIKSYNDLDLTCPMPGCCNSQRRFLLLEGDLKLKECNGTKVNILKNIFVVERVKSLDGKKKRNSKGNLFCI